MALINLRNALMAGKRLPYDAEVEWLQFTGAQYIDSGAIVSDPSTIEVGIDSDTPIPYGFTHQTNATGTWVSAYYANNTYYVNYKNYNNRWTSTQEPTTRALRVYDGDSGIYRDGTLQRAFTASVGTDSIANISWPIGCVWDFNSSGYDFRYAATGARIYRGYIKISGVLVRDFIPVRKGTVGYLYDRVSGKLFGNAGTGDFQYGPDVVPVEYIESHGTEWIDTGAKPTDSNGIKIEFLPIANASTNNIFGVYSRSSAISFRFTCNTSTASATGGYYWWNAGTSIANPSPWYNNKSTVSLNFLNDRKFIIDGIASYNISGTLTAMGHTLPILALNTPAGAQSPASARLYQCLISDGNATILHYKPVRVGTEGAMMDTLTRRIYRNQGTGAFGYGNDLKYPIPAS